MRPLATIVAIAAIAGCGKHPQQNVDPRIADSSRPLVLVTHPTEPPYAYIDDSGRITGEEIDLGRRIAAKMGRELVIETIDFADILIRLKAGTADMGISTLTITEARKRDVNFSVPYATGGSCFLYRVAGIKPRMSQVASLRIGVETDTYQDTYLCIHGCDPVRYTDLEEALSALRNGELDAVCFDEQPLREQAEKSGGVFAVTPLITRERYGVAVDKRRPDVLEAANAVIREGAGK